jgi:hypothetical protein
VVTHANAEASGDPPQKHGHEEGLPAEYKQCCHCAGVKNNHEERRYPNDRLLERPVTFEESWISHNAANTL